MGWVRALFWWLVSATAFALALRTVGVVQDKPWLTLLYVPIGLALLAGLIANPLVRPLIGLRHRPRVTLGLLAVLTLAAVGVSPFIVSQTQEYRAQLTARERATMDLVDRGNALLDAPGGERYIQDALALFRQACDRASGEGCFNAALLLSDEQSESHDPAEARTMYTFACNVRRIQAACGNLAMMLETGEGGPKDLRVAYDLFVQACRGGEDAACSNLQAVTAEFRANGVPAEATSALLSARISCEEDGLPPVCEFSRLAQSETLVDEPAQSASDGRAQ